MSIRACVVVLAVVALTLGSFAVAVAPASASRSLALPTLAPLASRVAAPVESPRLASPPAGGSAALSPRASLARGIVRNLEAAKVPMAAAYLPNLLNTAHLSNGVVQPLYTAAPAPMGIGDFGVRNTTGTPVGYVLQSDSWQATITVNRSNVLYLDDGAPDYFGIQLNTVMTNTTVAGNSTYQYWIQNVVYYSTATHTLRFIDNIWNFSNPSTLEPASTFFSFNGTPVSPVFYYDVYPAFNLPGFSVPYPFTVHLYENSSLTTDLVTGDVWSTVRFGYDVLDGAGVSLFRGVYDTVLFNSEVSTTDSPPTPMFTVNGTGYNPVGLLDDAEVMIGGPGGGSTTTVYAINGTESLQYLNMSSGRYANDPTAWNLGTDTGETVEGVSETYRSAGTVQLSAGPSIPMPLWNATPGGNIGDALLQGSANPITSFMFFNQGASFNPAQAAWAPLDPSGAYAFHLPPGTYDMVAEASEYDPLTAVPVLVNGTNTQDMVLFSDPPIGVYTPLWAWNVNQLQNLSTSGTGTAADPFLLENNERGPVDSLYGELNDFFYPVFPGIFIADTTAYVDINQPGPFTVVYPDAYLPALTRFGFPTSNELGIQAYNASHLSIWQGSFSGWFSGFLSSLPPFAPIGNIGFWGVTDSLIGDSIFTDQGSAIITALGGGNVIWGNTISPGPQFPSAYEFPYELGIQVFESGDLIYNNLVTTNIPAFGFNENLYTGFFQVNQDDWNLSAPEAATQVNTMNGYALTGSITGSMWQCGNSWGNYVPGSGLPYTDNEPFGIPLIQTGGDYCPYPLFTYAVTFTETGLSTGGWGVSLAGMVLTASAESPIVFQAPNGTFAWTVGAVPGRTVTPATGNVTVAGAGVSIGITIGGAFAAGIIAPPAADEGQLLSFAATATGGSGTYAYAWAFGDGATDTRASPYHAYSAAGTYTVDLWVNDTAGQSIHRRAIVTVSAGLSATATASATAVDVGISVTFSGTTSGGTGTAIVGWTFGDGTASPGPSSATHAFTAPGTYLVEFTATDALGMTVSAPLTVTVVAAPTASASASTTTPASGASVSFTGTSTGGTSPVAFAWTFGDGGTSTSQSPTHAYSAPGVYTVHFWVNDSVGGSATSTLTMVVSAPPAPPANVVDASTATIYAIVALLAGLAAGAAVMALVTRRRKGPSSPPEGPAS